MANSFIGTISQNNLGNRGFTTNFGRRTLNECFNFANFLLKKNYKIYGIDNINNYYSFKLKNDILTILKKTNKQIIFLDTYNLAIDSKSGTANLNNPVFGFNTLFHSFKTSIASSESKYSKTCDA